MAALGRGRYSAGKADAGVARSHETELMIKFTEAEPAKPKQAAPKPEAEKAAKPAPTAAGDEAPKAARKGKKSAPA